MIIKKLSEAQNHKCAYCGIVTCYPGESSNKDIWATIDHVVPRSKGGKSQYSNYVMACSKCNSEKSSHCALSFYDYKKDFGQVRFDGINLSNDDLLEYATKHGLVPVCGNKYRHQLVSLYKVILKVKHDFKPGSNPYPEHSHEWIVYEKLKISIDNTQEA